jgi:hypothetical protein
VKDHLDQAILQIQQQFVFELIKGNSCEYQEGKIINKIEAVEISRLKINGNSSTHLIAESIFSQIFLLKL